MSQDENNGTRRGFFGAAAVGGVGAAPLFANQSSRHQSGAAAFTAAGHGAVERTLLDKARDKLSPKDFGARLDGISDDTRAMQRTLDYAATREGGVVDLDGGTACSGALELGNCRGLSIRNGRINIKGDVTWLAPRPAANSITFFTIENMFFDCSAITTKGRACIDWSKTTYSTFRRLWFYTSNPGRSICLYASGDGNVGPYYNLFDTIYGGGHLSGIHIGPSDSVERTVNNNTMVNIRFNPGAPDRTGIIIGKYNQQNRIHDSVFEDTTGGIGIFDNGINTHITSCRFEHLNIGLSLGQDSAGGCDIGSYFDSNEIKRQYASPASQVLHNSLAESDGSGGPALNTLAGGLQIGGGLRMHGDSGFPENLRPGEAFAYSSPSLGSVDGGSGSTNDRSIVNGQGRIVARVPTGTTDWEVQGELRGRKLGYWNGSAFVDVTAGPPNSAGPGFRSLKVPN